MLAVGKRQVNDRLDAFLRKQIGQQRVANIGLNEVQPFYRLFGRRSIETDDVDGWKGQQACGHTRTPITANPCDEHCLLVCHGASLSFALLHNEVAVALFA